MKQETLGQIFKRYRQADNIKIEQIERETKISKRMILAVENDDYGSLPDDLYVKNIIKTYAKYLSLDFNRLLAIYEQSKEKGKLELNGVKKNRPARIILTPNRARNSLIGLIIVILLLYFGLQVNRIFKAPELIVYEPVQNLIIRENFIDIKGKAEKEARVFINEKEVFLNKNSEFKATLDLQKGLNIIKITAVKKHSKENTVYREILVQ